MKLGVMAKDLFWLPAPQDESYCARPAVLMRPAMEWVKDVLDVAPEAGTPRECRICRELTCLRLTGLIATEDQHQDEAAGSDAGSEDWGQWKGGKGAGNGERERSRTPLARRWQHGRNRGMGRVGQLADMGRVAVL